jgi:hypothetical protein
VPSLPSDLLELLSPEARAALSEHRAKQREEEAAQAEAVRKAEADGETEIGEDFGMSQVRERNREGETDKPAGTPASSPPLLTPSLPLSLPSACCLCLYLSSQFWYTDEFSNLIAQEAINVARERNPRSENDPPLRIACLSAPSAFKGLKRINAEDVQPFVFEFDKRFAAYGQRKEETKKRGGEKGGDQIQGGGPERKQVSSSLFSLLSFLVR